MSIDIKKNKDLDKAVGKDFEALTEAEMNESQGAGDDVGEESVSFWASAAVSGAVSLINSKIM